MARITYTPEERKARLASAHEELTAAVEAISTSADWVAFLEFARKLHQYSAQNRMWLFQQAMLRGWDDLGHVAGFRTWLELGRHVRKGERGLMVLAPMRVKVRGEDGEEHWALRGFKVEHVFAACQTDGDGEVPTSPLRPELLTGSAPDGIWDALAAQVAAHGFKLERKPLAPENGYTSFTTNIVVVADRLEDAAAAKTLAHELAHALLHRDVDYYTNRERCEVEAESVAYMVCRELGLETDQYSFPYVSGWARGDLKVVTAAADVALKAAGAILDAFEQASERVAA
jgi:antirestriction protein ArdC